MYEFSPGLFIDTKIVRDSSLNGVMPTKDAIYKSSAYPDLPLIWWAVPVLPATEKPLILAAGAVPSWTTSWSAFKTYDADSGEIICLEVDISSLIKVKSLNNPLFAKTEYADAIWKGLIVIP